MRFYFWFGTICAAVSVSLFAGGCSITAVRPTQEMSYTLSSIRAAKEVQADTLAPELYRQARDWFFKARREYKFKNFENARIAAKKARIFAERAEFEALSNGGSRQAQVSDSSSAQIYGDQAPQQEQPGNDAGFADPQSQYVEQFQQQQDAQKAPPPPRPK